MKNEIIQILNDLIEKCKLSCGTLEEEKGRINEAANKIVTLKENIHYVTPAPEVTPYGSYCSCLIPNRQMGHPPFCLICNKIIKNG